MILIYSIIKVEHIAILCPQKVQELKRWTKKNTTLKYP